MKLFVTVKWLCEKCQIYLWIWDFRSWNYPWMFAVSQNGFYVHYHCYAENNKKARSYPSNSQVTKCKIFPPRMCKSIGFQDAVSGSLDILLSCQQFLSHNRFLRHWEEHYKMNAASITSSGNIINPSPCSSLSFAGMDWKSWSTWWHSTERKQADLSVTHR